MTRVKDKVERLECGCELHNDPSVRNHYCSEHWKVMKEWLQARKK